LRNVSFGLQAPDEGLIGASIPKRRDPNRRKMVVKYMAVCAPRPILLLYVDTVGAVVDGRIFRLSPLLPVNEASVLISLSLSVMAPTRIDVASFV